MTGKKLISLVILNVFLFLFSGLASADEWDDIVKQADKQKLSEYKKKTSSGKRIIKEKIARIEEIDKQVPYLMQRGQYKIAEDFLIEALRLSMEYYGADNINVAERFISLGILYMEAGYTDKAEAVFVRARDIGEKTYGAGDYRLMNVYRFLAVAYYSNGKIQEAGSAAKIFVNISREKFGVDSDEYRSAENLLKQVSTP
ncbi:MAG TPA: tetratricopeptide repeat protein [Candidatus Omnitrophota bacterium]|nr:tetratricopeptide repeat protein [Candidatus Omnitrophota bacterium]HPS21152.1 tetratricopeptide repeat protein [Candidatus Omnitrophota bacterium]